MGCFCRNAVLPEDPHDRPEQDDHEEPDDSPARAAADPGDELVAAAADWLATRWLPAEQPWEPDPAWLDLSLPTLPMPPASVAVLVALATARNTVRSAFQLDPLDPEALVPLGRVVATLNRRTDMLQALADDPRPWGALARMNAQADTVLHAAQAGLLDREQPEPPDPSPADPAWRGLLIRTLPLAPLVAVGNLLDLDLSEPDALDELAQTVRQLAQVELPELEQPAVVMRALARNDAVLRLQRSLGAQPFRTLQEQVQRKCEAAGERLPPAAALVENRLLGMPAVLPNLAPVLNPATVEAASQLDPQLVENLTWQVPPYQELPLLTTGIPVATLVTAMPGVVRTRPCDPSCDAVLAWRAWSDSRRSRRPRGKRGSGTGAAPAA